MKCPEGTVLDPSCTRADVQAKCWSCHRWNATEQIFMC